MRRWWFIGWLLIALQAWGNGPGVKQMIGYVNNLSKERWVLVYNTSTLWGTPQGHPVYIKDWSQVGPLYLVGAGRTQHTGGLIALVDPQTKTSEYVLTSQGWYRWEDASQKVGAPVVSGGLGLGAGNYSGGWGSGQMPQWGQGGKPSPYFVINGVPAPPDKKPGYLLPMGFEKAGVRFGALVPSSSGHFKNNFGPLFAGWDIEFPSLWKALRLTSVSGGKSFYYLPTGSAQSGINPRSVQTVYFDKLSNQYVFFFHEDDTPVDVANTVLVLPVGPANFPKPEVEMELVMPGGEPFEALAGGQVAVLVRSREPSGLPYKVKVELEATTSTGQVMETPQDINVAKYQAQEPDLWQIADEPESGETTHNFPLTLAQAPGVSYRLTATVVNSTGGTSEPAEQSFITQDSLKMSARAVPSNDKAKVWFEASPSVQKVMKVQ